MNPPDGESRDLPARQFVDRDLPVTIAPEAAREEKIRPAHEGWSTYASQREVRALALSADGELWAATAGGILRWRTHNRFVRYGSEHGLPGNSIDAVVVDGTGCVWVIAGDGQLARFSHDRWRSCNLPSDAVPTCLAVDRLGNAWVGTATGLFAFDCSAQPAASLPFTDGYVPGEPPRAIAVVSENDAWGCSGQGLFHLENGRWHRRSERTGILTLAIGDGVLWLGTLDGLTRIDLLHDNVNSWKRGMTTAIAITADGVWAASGGHVGLATDTHWRPVAGQSLGFVTALVQTDNDEVCAGTFTGIVRCGFARSEPWSTAAAPDVIGLSSSLGTLIQAIAIGQREGERVVWAGTALGLFEFVPSTGTWRQLGGRRVEDVRALATAGASMWVGSWRSGLRELRNGILHPAAINSPIVAVTADTLRQHCFAAGTDTVYRLEGTSAAAVVTAEELQPGTWFSTVTVGEDGTLWIGAAAGLFAYTQAAGTTVVRGDLVGTEIVAILSKGNGPGQLLLVGTSRGLYAGAPGQLTAVEALTGRAITALAWDGIGIAAWVGTDAGLMLATLRQGEWIVTTEMTAAGSGLAANRVTALAVDNSNQLWIGTPSGLSSYQPWAIRKRKADVGRH